MQRLGISGRIQSKDEEKRRYPRYGLKRGAFAVLSATQDLFSRIGQILDVSEGGLAFWAEDEKEWPPSVQFNLEVFGYEAKGLRIKQIPCRLVYQVGFAEESLRCGIELLDLSEKQQALFHHFVRTNTLYTF